MNFLAKKLLEALSQNISDSSYLADKQADFEQLDTLAAARKMLRTSPLWLRCWVLSPLSLPLSRVC